MSVSGSVLNTQALRSRINRLKKELKGIQDVSTRMSGRMVEAPPYSKTLPVEQMQVDPVASHELKIQVNKVQSYHSKSA